MKNLHIERVVLAEDGIVVTYTDQTSAFYHESVLMTHLAAERGPVRLGKPAQGDSGRPAPAQSSRRHVA